MVQLKCRECGGTLERDEATVIQADGIVFIRAGGDFECPYCGCKYTPGEEAGAVIVQRVEATGRASVAIGGSVRGSTIITSSASIDIDEVREGGTVIGVKIGGR